MYITAGDVGVRITNYTSFFYNRFDRLVDRQTYSEDDFVDTFNDCGPGSSYIAAGSTVCGYLCVHLGGEPNGSIVEKFYGIDDNGNEVSVSERVLLNAD